MKLTRFLPCLALLLAVPSARATISFEIDADLLSNSSNVGIPDGSAIFLVVDTTGAGFALPKLGAVSVGSAWGGSSHNFVAETYSANGAAFNSNANDAGAVSFNTNAYPYSTVAGMGANQHLGLFWFPTLGYNASSISIIGGDTYGYFDFSSTGSGAASWITPPDGNFGIFFTINTPNAVSFGTGNDIVNYGVVVPEPSTFALLGGISAMGLALLRRRRQVR